jgi:AmiR/NasT family two-component response regulator
MSDDNRISDLLARMTRGTVDVNAIVHQASGILMVRRGITIEGAVAALHEIADASGVSVTEAAASIVTSTQGRNRSE